MSTNNPLQVLVYSDDSDVRKAVMDSIGNNPHPDVAPFQYTEVATHPALIKLVDNEKFDLLILDGEAVPAGGLGVARQLKHEIFNCPPILVITGRPQDSWLAAWSMADAAVSHPIDAFTLAEAAIGLVRPVHV